MQTSNIIRMIKAKNFWNKKVFKELVEGRQKEKIRLREEVRKVNLKVHSQVWDSFWQTKAL